VVVIPNKVSFAEVASTHQTGKQPFQESLLLLLVKRGLTVTIDYGYFGFASKRGDQGGDEVDVLFHWWLDI